MTAVEPWLMKSLICRHMRSVPGFVRAEQDRPPVVVELDRGEELVGWYRDANASETLVFTTEAMCVYGRGAPRRLPWAAIASYDLPPKVETKGVSVYVGEGSVFVPIGGSRGPDDKFKDAYNLVQLLHALVPSLSHAITRYIREYLASADERVEWVRRAIRKHDFLPLYLGWVAALGIRPDGTVVRWAHDDNPADAHEIPPVPETALYWQRVALAEGAKRYPVLRRLFPERPPEAITCDQCEGSGVIPGAEGMDKGPICRCGGLGWLLEGEPPSNPP